MNRKSIGLTILWWCETIIAIRVLLFTMPVIINKYWAGNFLLSGVNDRFIIVLSATALLFFVVGIASIIGYRYWKAIHYLAAVFTLVLTVGSLSVFSQPSDIVGVYYFTPIFVSIVFVCFAGFLGSVKRPA